MTNPPNDILHALPPYEWIRWVSGTDVAVLLMVLCKAIDTPEVTRETLVTMVQDWRANALKALDDDAWTAEVDGYLEVRANARAWLASQGKL